MSKWADYVITGVRYDQEHTHIEKLEVRGDSGSSLGSANIRSRQEVVNSIKHGVTYVTAPPSKQDNGKWQKGDNVRMVRVNGVDYLRTDGNLRASDNLGELPEI